MGVYINGMEMPKPGHYEAVIIVLDKSTAEIGISPAEDDIGYWKEYPLVPVPPHGDLKDADALIERIEFEVRHYVVKDEFDKGRVAAWNNVIRAIREYAPTIIPAEQEKDNV